MKEFARKPEGLFAALSVFFGLLFVFLVPPMQTPDEQSHFYQSYAISNLKIFPEKFTDEKGQANYGVQVPVSVAVAAETLKASVAGKPTVEFDKHLFKNFITQPLEPAKVKYQASTSLYAPVVYLPQAIGITVGKVFNTPPLIMMWLARIANLALWILLISLAIKILPFGKWAMAILALNPMAVFLSASLSADVVTTALVFLLFSMVASWLVRKDAMSYRWMSAFVGVLGLLAFTKPVNVLFALLLFAIPWQRFTSLPRYFIFTIGASMLTAIIGLLWNRAVSEASYTIARIMRPGVEIVPSEQIAWILHHPFEYIKVLLVNYVIVPPGYPGDEVFRSFFGTFGWFDTTIPLWTIVLFITGLLLALFYQAGRDAVVTLRQKIILLSIFILFIVGNITAMYAFFTPVGSLVIAGVQGRYFIPGAILIIGLFTMRKKILNIREKTLAIILGSITSIVLASSLLTVIARYYT